MRGFNGAVTSTLRKSDPSTAHNSVGRCFNGAVTSTLRKSRRCRCPLANHCKCFNGAVTSTLRKSPRPGPALVGRAGLQWGRNFYVTEIPTCRWSASPARTLQWGRNFYVTEMSGVVYTVTVTATLQWGRNFYVTEIVPFPGAPLASYRLQWGRNFYVTEITPAGTWQTPRLGSFNGAVTSTLRKFELGNLDSIR